MSKDTAQPEDEGMRVFEQYESEVRGYCRSFPAIFATARNAVLSDDKGVEYIDFLSGAGTLNYGHNNPVLKERLIEYLQADGLVHGLDMASVAKKDFLETLQRVILRPREFEYKVQFPGPTGTNAVEAAFKLARKVTGRQNIVSFTNGFHGVSLGSLAATGNSHFRSSAGVSLSETTFMPYDGYMGEDIDTLDYFEQLLKDGSSGLDMPAAVIVETVQGEGGVNVASFGWLRRLERICSEWEIVFIVDDIQVGCGRTGTFFSFEKAGINPDIITLSKSLSGFGLPMSVVLMKPEYDQWEPSQHNGTFRGNNLGFLTAAEAIRRYWQDDAFTKDILAKGEVVRERLTRLVRDYSAICTQARGRGMINGLVCEPTALAAEVSSRCFQQGLIIETSGASSEVLKVLPPLTIPTEQLKEGLDILADAIKEVHRAYSEDEISVEADGQ